MTMMLFLVVMVSIAVFSDCTIIKDNNVREYKLEDSQEDSHQKEWWETAVFYQIYPRSFKDSNNDGIGDLKGIIEKLDHLQDAGVTATWLSPIFLSPQKDQGYDIQDYYKIQPEYGTLDDLKTLIEEAHKRGIKVILDFVPNHTSNLHDWFVKSEKRVGYEDYYVWRNAKALLKDGTPVPPNNWISNFKDSAWEWSENRKQFYLHQFAIQQPDLNYNNPKVVEDMKDVLRYWLKFGVDGFRIDAVPTLFEDPDEKDEPKSGNANAKSNDYDYLNHIYTLDQDKTFDMIYQWRQVLDEYNKNQDYPRILMTEAYSPINKIFLYYGANETTPGAHFTFNFNFIKEISKEFTVDDIANAIHKWESFKPKRYISNWVLGNHDNPRIATRLGKENVDAFNMLAAILPGVLVTYNGEEIGMENGDVKCEEGFDPQAIKNCDTFNQISRDFERTPFHWDNSTNAGFSEGNKTWLPVSEKYKEVNLAAQNKPDVRSHYNVYKSLIQLRKDFVNSSFDSLAVTKLSKHVLEVIRKTDSVEYVYLFNAGDVNDTVATYTQISGEYEVVVSSVNSAWIPGDVVDVENVQLAARESIILKKQPPTNGSAQLSASMAMLALSIYYVVILFC